MMRLSVQDFPAALTPARALHEHAAVSAILSGAAPGAVYADDPRHPQALLILPANRWRVYLAGDATLETFNLAAARLLRERYRKGDGAAPGEYLVHYAPEPWEAACDALLGDMLLFKALSRTYRFAGESIAPVAPPQGFVVEPIDAALLARGYANTERMIGEMLSESPSVEYFLASQGGMCARHGNTLAGWCMIEYRHGARCELGIETLEEYRRMGIATATATALVAQLLSAGVMDVGWQCWDNNAGSIAVAERVGFQLVSIHPSWYGRGPA